MNQLTKLPPSILPESLSPSQLVVYLTCEQKWDFQYAKRLIPYGPDWLHFAKGTYLHDLLHFYYSLLQSGYKIGDEMLVKAMVDRINTDREEVEKKAEENDRHVDYAFFADCSRTIMRYITDRSPLIDQGLSDFQIEQHLEFEFDGRNFHGFADLIYTRKGRVIIRDHKTGTRDTYSEQKVYRNAQLFFYAVLYYKLTGVVPIVEVSWIHSDQPKKPVKTKLWSINTIEHTAAELDSFWDYLVEVHNRQKNTTPLRNLSECDSCVYYNVCSFQLKKLDASLIVRANYEHKPEIKSGPETTGGSSPSGTSRVFNFVGREDQN